MEKIIYYFSGTGNSLRASRVIGKKLGGTTLVSMGGDPKSVPAVNAQWIGFVCPVYEWDIPGTVKHFLEELEINPDAYIFMVATYVAIHGRCFETVDRLLRQKHARLDLGVPLRCVASQCTAYEPFPPARLMVPWSDRRAEKIGEAVASRQTRPYPRMSPVSRRLYPKMMLPFIRVAHEYDKGFYTTDACVGCELCRRICPCHNITFDQKHPVWNHACLGCNACVVYCPTKAIQFQTPQAYQDLDNVISRRLGLPENRTRYHNPYITAKDLLQDTEFIP